MTSRIVHALGVILLLLLAVPAQAQSRHLPELGDASGGVLTPAEEMELGRTLLREVRRVLPLVADPEVNFYLDSLGRRLLANAPDAVGPFHFLPIANGQVNAFAMPGGIVGVHTGLFLEARDEAELAAVIAHEIAHITQRHIARMFARGRDANIATGLAILAGILAAAIDPQLAQAAIAGSIAAQIQGQLDYTRLHEAEADRVGIQILAAAGFDPQAMADFFERMQELTRGAQDRIPEYLRTHPVTLGRISDARNRASQMPAGGVRDSTHEFVWIQARLRALDNPRRSLTHFQALKSAASPVQIYEAFVAQLQLGDLTGAQALLERIQPRQAPALILPMAQVQLAQLQERWEDALAILAELAIVYPGHPVVGEWQARVQHDAGEHQAAVRSIDQLLRQRRTPDPNLLRLKAEAADAAGLIAISREAMAEYFLHRGQPEEAVRQFDDALLASDASRHDIERIEHKRDAAQQIARERKR